MIKSRIAVAGVLLASAGAASAAGLTVTPTIASDYDFRGFSQTNEGVQDGDIAPTFQVGANYGFENGIYLGAWASNVDFGTSDPKAEIDAYVGYAGGDAAESIGYDVGVVAYNYPSASDLNYLEAYAGISHGMFAGKLWYSPEFGGESDESAFYVEGNVTVPLPANFSALGHVGYSFGDYWKAYYPKEYVDYSVGVGYSISNFSLALKYINTNFSGWDGDKVVLSASTTLPWAK
jgi:uncharacterized protein (TIGR02001 family)